MISTWKLNGLEPSSHRFLFEILPDSVSFPLPDVLKAVAAEVFYEEAVGSASDFDLSTEILS